MSKAGAFLKVAWAQRQLELASALLPAGASAALRIDERQLAAVGNGGAELREGDPLVCGFPLTLDGKTVATLLLHLPAAEEPGRAQAWGSLLAHGMQGLLEAEHARRSVAEETLNSYRELALLQRVVAELNGSLNPTAVASTLLKEFAGSRNAADFGAVLLRRREKASLSTLECFGDEAATAFAALMRSHLFAEMEVREQGDIVDDLRASPLWAAETAAFRSLMWLPLRAHGEDLGLLVLASRRTEGFTAADMKRAQTLVSVAASALRNARLYAAEQIMSQSLVSVISIGTALSNERDINCLLEAIMVAAKSITHADGGTLYLTDADRKSLRFEIMRNDSLGTAMGGTSGKPIDFPNLPLRKENGEPNNAMVAAYVAIHGETVNIADAYEADGFDFSGTRRFDQSTGYRSKSFLTVPMHNHEKEIIGVLQLINSVDPDTGRVMPFSVSDQRLAESLASQAAIALSNRQLILQLEELFVAFINLINLAIDEKSPYTAGHCVRVPILTMMLAEAALEVAAEPGHPLAGFAMDERDLHELKIAGMLHDCGKITTPVHVVDKATKLEAIHDRIHEVDTRFEVLKRDVENAQLRAQLALRTQRDAAAEARLAEAASAALALIEEDREFIRRSNAGGEFMRDADLARIQAIAEKYSWHDASGRLVRLLSAEEAESLSIRAGTLTAAERETINHHIVATIRMLEQLPWSKNLKNVPAYAGCHHERMDGKGYPRGLKREDMPVQARIIGVADIFEALTARDRPYKKGKALSESLQILGRMKEGGHIDPDLFDIFIRRKVYLKYAQEYLDPQQIDEIDESKLPGYAPQG